MKINTLLLLVFIVTIVIGGIYLQCAHKMFSFSDDLKQYKTNNLVTANDEEKYKNIIPIDIAMCGTNVLYNMNGRDLPRDMLFRQLSRYANANMPVKVKVNVVLYASEETPIGVLHDLEHDVTQSGFRYVDCIITGRERTKRKIEFSDVDKQLIIIKPPVCGGD